MLYLRRSPRNASPKAISGSTSYLQACLVFRSYPHLIPTLFSGFRFGPPPRFTGASAWTRIDRLASGLPHATQALFRRGPFHLSLTVLCAIGSRRVLSLGGWSPQLPPGFLVSRRTQARRQALRASFAYGAFTLSGRPSQAVPLASLPGRSPRHRPTTPRGSLPWVWALPLSLAATKGVSS